MNNNYSVIYSSEARNDIKNVYSYIAFELLTPDTAKNQVNRIRKAVRSLGFMPSRHPVVDWELMTKYSRNSVNAVPFAFKKHLYCACFLYELQIETIQYSADRNTEKHSQYTKCLTTHRNSHQYEQSRKPDGLSDNSWINQIALHLL